MPSGAIRIPVDHGQLEAIVREPSGTPRGAAVVCHPHPLHGGTMHTKAVYRAAQGLNEAGLVTLRFNFRGVGTSTGSHDDGVGERDDLGATLDWLERSYPSLPLVAGGFSFGSMVGLSVGATDARVSALLGLGLPVTLEDRYDYGYLASVGKPTLVVQGDLDEFGSGDDVESRLGGLGAHVTVVRITQADHFFTDRLEEVREAVRGYFDSGPGSSVLLSP